MALAPGTASAVPTDGATGAFRDTRALWMSRFEFTTETEIRDRVAAVADAGFTDLYFQVRGQGDVLYPSAIETWDAKYAARGNVGPGFDPLAVALDAAGQHGLDPARLAGDPGNRGLANPPIYIDLAEGGCPVTPFQLAGLVVTVFGSVPSSYVHFLLFPAASCVCIRG